MTGIEELPGRTNYLIGNDSTGWWSDIPNYAKVKYQAVYPGVDLIYYGNQQQLEYDFIVAPNVNPEVITLGFAGAEKLEVDGEGDLVVHVAGEQVRMHKPVIYQERHGQREEVAGGYVLRSLVAGERESLPVNAVQSTGGAFVTKMNAAGVFVYSTYLGGGGPRGIAVDGSGNVYVTGITFSSNFPTVNAAQTTLGGGADGFVTKLNATGGYVYSTYLGGGSEDEPRAFAVDGSGNAYVTGNTASLNFQTVNAVQSTPGGGLYDTFVTKLNAAGEFVYSTYLGGSSYDYSQAIAVDGTGSAYVTGHSYSSNFPTVNAVQSTFGSGFYDGFVTKLNTTGGFVYSTYLGGNDYDNPFSIAADGSGNVYVAGSTNSPNFPTVNAVQSIFGGVRDVFMTKLNAAGGFAYSTYFGGSNDDNIVDFVTDGSGHAYVIGSTASPNLPVVNAVQSVLDGTSDIFVTKLNAVSGIAYSTYLGGIGEDQPRAVAVDGSGNAYVAGYTSSLNFPTANAVQSSFAGVYDAFVTKIAENQPPTTDAGGPYDVDEGTSATVTASGDDPENEPLIYTWDLDNDGSFETAGQSVSFSAASLDGPGTHTINVQVTDSGNLTATHQAIVNVLNVAPTAAFTAAPNTVIAGQSATLIFSSQLDPSTTDVTAGFLYSYDCNNDGTFEVNDVTATTSHTCPYPTSGTFTAKGRITDKDGGYTDYTVEVVVQTPQQGIQGLIEKVQTLVAASALNQGNGNALISKLEAAIKQLDQGHTHPAINQLEAFTNQVNAFLNSGKLTSAQGQPLLDGANQIITALSGAGTLSKNTANDPGDGAIGADPAGFVLEQNAPNPFNPVTTIQFAVPHASQVKLKVYNLAGQEVATLVDQPLAPGVHRINWDASRLVSGVYIYRLEAEGSVQTKRLLLMK
ncbi:MAG: SBBP repeat-containing protein [bacterium]